MPLTWLGLRWADVDDYGIPPGALQAMTVRDEAKATALLNHPRVSGVPALVDDLREALERRQKMELEGALQLGIEFLSSVYLPDRMASFDPEYVRPAGPQKQQPALLSPAPLPQGGRGSSSSSGGSEGPGSGGRACFAVEEEEEDDALWTKEVFGGGDGGGGSSSSSGGKKGPSAAKVARWS